MGSSWRGALPLQHAGAVFVAELLGSEAGAATEVAAEEGEVGEVVLVADLLHRLRGVLDGGLELQDDEVIDDLLGSAAVVHAAYAAEVLGGDVEPLGIGVDGVELLAVVVDKEHELVEDAERGGAGPWGRFLARKWVALLSRMPSMRQRNTHTPCSYLLTVCSSRRSMSRKL